MPPTDASGAALIRRKRTRAVAAARVGVGRDGVRIGVGHAVLVVLIDVALVRLARRHARVHRRHAHVVGLAQPEHVAHLVGQHTAQIESVGALVRAVRQEHERMVRVHQHIGVDDLPVERESLVGDEQREVGARRERAR